LHFPHYGGIDAAAHRQGNDFGEVVEGQDLANKITAVRRGRNDRPNKDVVLKKVEIERA
jgi:cyclophilin family peptidyl-prolyl cis-trans isomerase